MIARLRHSLNGVAHSLVNIFVAFARLNFFRFRFGIMCFLKTESRNIMTCLQATVAATLLMVLLVHAGKT